MQSLPVEIIVRIACYLSDDKDKLNLLNSNRFFRWQLSCHLEFDTLVWAETVRYLPYYNCFVNVRLSRPNLRLPKATRGLRFEMWSNNVESSTNWRIFLPPKLQRLVIRADFRGLPLMLPNITHLDLDSKMLHKIRHLLPVTLTHLTCRFQNSMFGFPDISNSYITHLRLFSESGYPKINTAHLPRNLTHLKKNKYITIQNMNQDFLARILTWHTACELKRVTIERLTSVKNITSVGVVYTESLPQSVRQLTCRLLVATPCWYISSIQSLSLAICGHLDLNIMPQLRHLLITKAASLLNLRRHQMLECLIVGDNNLIFEGLPSSLRYLRAPRGENWCASRLTHLVLTHQNQDYIIPHGVTHLSLGGPIRNLDILLPETLRVLSITTDYLAKANHMLTTLPNLTKIFLRHTNNKYQNQPCYLHSACYLSGYKSYRYISIHDADSESESESESEVESSSGSHHESIWKPTLAGFSRHDINVYLEPDVEVDVNDYPGIIYHLNCDMPVIDIDFRIMDKNTRH